MERVEMSEVEGRVDGLFMISHLLVLYLSLRPLDKANCVSRNPLSFTCQELPVRLSRS